MKTLSRLTRRRLMALLSLVLLFSPAAGFWHWWLALACLPLCFVGIIWLLITLGVFNEPEAKR